MEQIHKNVSEYYGKTLSKSDDLKTNACCTVVSYPQNIKTALSKIHSEVLEKYYGCGLTIPTTLNGLSVLDLGSGSGRDCYLLSQLVGEQGSVTGVDMTDEQLDVANRHLSYHAEQFGYKASNVRFLKGHIEQLDKLDFHENQFDLIISNCVVNLASDKEAVLKQAHRILKDGGEFYFSDVYVDKRVPQHLVDDPVLYGECLSGSLYWNDFENLARRVGFADPRIVDVEPITIDNAELQKKTEGLNFSSITYRLFKIQDLEPDCEDYGQAVRYKGTIDESPGQFKLDRGHVFEKGKMHLVCGNSYLMLKNGRLAEHFDFFGDFSVHHGIFEGCGLTSPIATTSYPESSSCC